MNFQKSNNNNSTKMMTMMREKTAQKNIKYEDNNDEQQDDGNNNIGVEGDEEMMMMGKSVVDGEDKKQKRVVGSSVRRSGTGTGGVGGGSGVVTCQAEKCTVDLTDAKRYHRRHKVCEFHAKAPSVLVYGLRQRFCQQCSRFHELSEFDDTKRSCRRRLAGHNERRRKTSSEPQAEGGSSSSRAKAANPQCRPVDQSNRVQMSSYPTESPTYKPFQIR